MRTLFNAGIAACMVTLLLYPIIANAKTVRDGPCTATAGKTERRSRTTARADVSALSYSKIGSYGQSVKAGNEQLSVRGVIVMVWKSTPSVWLPMSKRTKRAPVLG